MKPSKVAALALLLVSLAPHICWGAPPGLEVWDSDGAWTRLGETHVLALMGACFLVALLAVIARELFHAWRRHQSHSHHHHPV
jgi:hypothetical protein